jgi:hypothetical protein
VPEQGWGFIGSSQHSLQPDLGFLPSEMVMPIAWVDIAFAVFLYGVGFFVSGVLPPSCGGRRSSKDANGVDRIGSHIWSTI